MKPTMTDKLALTMEPIQGVEYAFEVYAPINFGERKRRRLGRIFRLQCGEWICIAGSATIHSGLSPVSTTKPTKEEAFAWVQDVYEAIRKQVAAGF